MFTKQVVFSISFLIVMGYLAVPLLLGGNKWRYPHEDFAAMKVRKIRSAEDDISQIEKIIIDEFSRQTAEIQANRVETLSRFHQLDEALSILSTRVKTILETVNNETSCKTLRANGYTCTGVYDIKPNRGQAITTKVYCDMADSGGGWTVLQRRGVRQLPKAERISFNRNWTEYENGFASPEDDHWIGLKNIHSLTRGCQNEVMFKLTAWNGTEFFALYSNFQVSGSDDDYRVTIGSYIAGTLPDNPTNHTDFGLNNMKFTTYDRQNDKKKPGNNCAVGHRGPWWHNKCADDSVEWRICGRRYQRNSDQEGKWDVLGTS